MTSDPPRSPLSVLRRKNFALFWTGQAVSLTGTWMQVLAQNWVVVTFTTSAFALGLLNFASSLPMMLLTLYGGVAADKWDKRRILIFAQVMLMVLAFALAGLYASGHLQLWHIYVLAVFSGIASAYEMPANQAFTPELVEPEEIPQAVALNNASFHGSRIVGPALAGFVIYAWGITSAFVANGFSFLAVLFSLMFVRAHRPSERRMEGSTLEYMKAGMRYVRERPRLMILMGFSATMTLLVFPNLIVLMPLYAKEALNTGSRGFGYLMSSSGVGALIGSLLLLTIPHEQRPMRIGLGLAGVATALIVMGLSQALWLSCLGIFLNSLSFSTVVGLANTILQEVVPGHLRGRVMSLNTLTFVGIMPFASLLMTGLAEVIGLRAEMLACGVLYGIVNLVLFRMLLGSPEIADYEEEGQEGLSAAGAE
ncbi:MAG: MFS transporter [Armatimonadetes bacterium]|nr:MFS transporter [Armatimonadota bacterium]